MGLFNDIPVRSNGADIFASWFNTIRTALLGAFGTEQVQQTSFAGATSQTDADVTGLIFDKTITESVTAQYSIKTATLFEKGTFELIYDGTIWALHSGSVSGDDSLITFGVDSSSGQVEYTSGAETSVIKFKATTFNI